MKEKYKNLPRSVHSKSEVRSISISSAPPFLHSEFRYIAPLWLLWPSILQGEIELLRSKRRSNLLNFPYVKLIITEVCECVCLNYMALILDIIRMCNERTCLEWSETWILQRVWTRWKVLDIWKIL